MTPVFESLYAIENIVNDLLPPAKNHLIGKFEVKFYLSQEVYDKEAHKFPNGIFKMPRNIYVNIERASIEREIEYLESIFDPKYEYSDVHQYWRDNLELKRRIEFLKEKNIDKRIPYIQI